MLNLLYGSTDVSTDIGDWPAYIGASLFICDIGRLSFEITFQKDVDAANTQLRESIKGNELIVEADFKLSKSKRMVDASVLFSQPESRLDLLLFLMQSNLVQPLLWTLFLHGQDESKQKSGQRYERKSLHDIVECTQTVLRSIFAALQDDSPYYKLAKAYQPSGMSDADFNTMYRSAIISLHTDINGRVAERHKHWPWKSLRITPVTFESYYAEFMETKWCCIADPFCFYAQELILTFPAAQGLRRREIFRQLWKAPSPSP